jgi:hypothetical protein
MRIIDYHIRRRRHTEIEKFKNRLREPKRRRTKKDYMNEVERK